MIGEKNKLIAGNHLVCTQRDNKGKPIAWVLIYIDKSGKEHPRKP